MIIARIELELQPSQQPSFRHYARSEAARARVLEGCVRYAFHEDVADPLRVLLYEEWTSREAFEAYKASPLFAEAGQHLRPMLAAPPKSAYYESEDLFARCGAG